MSKNVVCQHRYELPSKLIFPTNPAAITWCALRESAECYPHSLLDIIRALLVLHVNEAVHFACSIAWYDQLSPLQSAVVYLRLLKDGLK